MLASFALILLTPALAQEPERDPRVQRQLDRREQELAAAVEQRDLAFDALQQAYDDCEWAWQADEPLVEPAELPVEIQSWLTEQALQRAAWPARRAELQQELRFHEWWNTELFRLSPAARTYSAAVQTLEECFLEVEKLRHPERFAKGFDQTPPGMVLVPTGSYPIGPHFGRIDGFPDSEKQRTVKVDAFYLDRAEVSCASYLLFLLAQPDGLRSQHMPLDWERDGQDLPVVPEGEEDSPVVGIAWSSAAAYARWAGKRLPTEIEWEAAAAGTEGRMYARPNGYDAQRINCRATGKRAVRPISEFTEDRTPLGILGLAGNAAEWTGDLWLAPLQPGRRARALDAPREGAEAVVKGGSYLATAEACRNAYRALYPAVGRAYRHVGFRCAQDLP
ncbi:MAG: hypothetical protein CMJ94_05025 [Planctomycetes bacterium]|nr:hypothetical protein [Planctomycetota bacterium]